jgi:hypothetical protein
MTHPSQGTMRYRPGTDWSAATSRGTDRPDSSYNCGVNVNTNV